MTRNYIDPAGLLTSERSVLGGVMIKPDLLGELDLEVSDFVDARHRLVFAAMRNLESDGIALDLTTLGALIERAGSMDAVGGFAFLGEIMLSVPIAENVHEYAKLVRDEAIKRAVVEAAGDVIKLWKEESGSGRELLDLALGALTRLDADQVRDDTRHISELTREHVAYLEEESRRRAAGSVEITGYPTGVADLDKLIGGWQPGIVSVVCARPGHGKSSLCLASAIAATAKGIGVHVFSMEDPRRIYMNRALAHMSKVSVSRISTCEFLRGDLDAFAYASREMTHGSRRWLIDDRSGISSDDVVRSVRRHRRKNDTKLVIVDYLQLMKRSRSSLAKSKHEAIGDSLNELADAAKNDGMAYVVVSQLNRGLESRDDKRPHESDLRESGTIEERAKCIVGVYRGRKYTAEPVDDIDTNLDGSKMSPHVFNSTVQLLILKNSQGPAPERVVANWHGETTRIW